MPVKEADKERLKHFFDEGDPDEIFILEEEIASGSFGAVYKGRHAQNGKYYAVKIITPEEDEVLEDFMVEISVLRRCKNENIVGYYGSWLKGEELFIAMELCDGGAVSDIFQVSQDPLTEDQIALITRETLKAIAYLHANGIIHRDIKGANILLTNDGEIKLVDFGVSAELRHPGDRRNTLIGTPYWMAPEVISNKTGNVPYDQKADIWSLGITLLELAERNPPLHEIHPMKALMMIPMRDAPSFTHPEHWSKDFREFVALCLIKQPEKRKTAEDMLKHPFVVNVKGKQVLLELIQKRKKLEAKARAEEDNKEEDSSDLEDSSEDEEDDLPPTPAVLKNASSPPQKTPNNRNSLPPNEPPPKMADSPAWQNKKPSTSAPKNPMLHASGHGENLNPKDSRDDSSSDGSFLDSPTPPRKPKEGTNRPKGTNRGPAPTSGNPNRPTYRTNRKLTRREIKNHEKQLIMRNLLKQQLKELRAQQQQHIKEQEKQQRAHQREQENLTSRFNAQLTSKQKTTAKDLNAMQNRHKTELENYAGNAGRNQKKLQQQHLTILKSTMKNTEGEFKKQEKEFKDKLKEQIKEHKNTLKDKSKTLTKKDVKLLKSEHEFNVGWQELLFTQKQGRASSLIEFEKKVQLFQEQERSETEVLEKRLQIQWEQLDLQQQFVSDALQQQHQVESEQLGQQHPLEFKHFQERQELERLQLSQYLSIEDKQQKFLLSTELKNQLKDFRKQQQKEQMTLAEQVKQLPKQFKTLGKKELKQKADEMKAVLQQKMSKLQAEFNEMQNKQKSEEEDLIKTSQALRIEQKRQEHEEQLKKIKEEHESQLKKIAESHQQQEKELKEKQKKEKHELLEEQHKAVKDLQRDHHRLYEEIMTEFQNSQRKLLDEQHQEQMSYKSKSPNPQDTDVAKLKLEQDDEKRSLIERQQKDRDAFITRCEQEQKVMGAELLNQKRKLEEHGRREPLYDTSSTQVSRTYSEH